MRSNALPRLEGEPEFEKGLATTRELLPVQDHMVHIKGACIIAMRKSLAMRASSVCPFVCYIRGQCSVGLNLISHYIPERMSVLSGVASCSLLRLRALNFLRQRKRNRPLELEN